MFRLLALVLLSAAAFPAGAQMYKCVDERGVTHYTDKPRPDCKGGKVDIQPIPSLSGSTAPPAGDVARQDAEFKRRQIEGQESEAREKAALVQRCARLRQEHDFLSYGGRISQTDAQGKRVYVDDTTRASRLAQVKDQLRVCP
ncbi:MAG TPA: DUF4124 domain-containing protein [Burkholderiales bacterium]|nr:DUF4124 domain-containing protein [Burkholderiales bacterium]